MFPHMRALAMASARAAVMGAGPYSGYALALDFKNGLYRDSGGIKPDLLSITGATYTRSGAKKEEVAARDGSLLDFAANVPGVVPGEGFWLRNANTNLLLNSATLSTQSVTVTAASYTFTFFGTGSVTFSGTGTGTIAGTGANTRVSAAVTCTAGSLTATVTGTVTFATMTINAPAPSIIVTAGSTATVGADTPNITTSALSADADFVILLSLTLINAANGTVYACFNNGTTNERIKIFASSSLLTYLVTVGGVALATASTVAPALGSNVMLFRRRGGKNTLITKAPTSVITSTAESAVTAFPTLTQVSIGQESGVAQPNGPMSFFGLQMGTFSDTDISNMVGAA
jgi:hypothetical protein